MPYSIRKLPNQNLYRVYNTETKEVHSYGTSLENAKKQVKLLHMIDAGVPLKKQGGSIRNPKLLELFKGTGSVGKQAKKMGFQVTSLDLDPIYTPDIETDILEWDYKKWATENNYVPDMIWSSPPCNTFSPFVYRLKEREVETAKPLSERAKLGTKILYRTLEIIEYFLKKNPRLLFVIENPRGMMRKDAKMKKLERETTLYCLYGDFKRKPTDFWNNFPQGLNLDQETKQCPNKTILVKNLKIDQRYSIPSKLIKHFLDEFKKQYGEIKGAGIETDKFEEQGIVSLPEFRSVKINLPTYMYKRLPDINGKAPTYRYKLVIPITSSRNLSSRKQETSLDINQKPVANPNVVIKESEDEPKINDFSPADRRKIQDYYYRVKQNERRNPDDIDKDAYEIVERGRPLPCDKPRPKKVKVPKEPESSSASIASSIPFPSKAKSSSSSSVSSDKLSTTTKSSSQKSKASSKAPSVASSKASSKAPSVASEKAPSVASEKSMSSDDLNLYLNDREAFNKKFGLGIKNNILPINKNMANSWIQYVKEYASKNGMSYRDALRCPNCRAGYKKGGAVVKKGRGVVDELGNQDLIAIAYEDSELGANAGKKFISL